MAVTVSWQVTPAAPNHGDTVTAVIDVNGNDEIPAAPVTARGSATVGTQVFNLDAVVTMPGTPALPVSYAVPTCPGLEFNPTDQPNIFTATVP